MLAIVVLACGPRIDDDDVYPRNCGEVGPVDLSDVPGLLAGARPVGEHVLLWLGTADDTGGDIVAVPRCGGDAVQLARVSLDDLDPGIGTAGGHIVRCDPDTGAVDWLDPDGEAPPHRLFDAAWGCRLHAVAGGLAALDPRDDTVLWHPEPADPTTTASMIAEGARLGDLDSMLPCSVVLDECPLGLSSVEPLFGPEAAGDVLLVPTPERGLVEVDVRTGSISEPLIEDVEQIAVLDDPRYVRWVDREGRDEHLLDRRTGISTLIDHGFDSIGSSVSADDRWAVSAVHGPPISPPPAEPWTVLRAYHLASGRLHEIEGRDGWRTVGFLGSDRIVVEIDPIGPEEPQRYVVWPTSGERVPVDVPGDAVAFGDDLLLFEPLPDDDVSVVRRLSARDLSVETIADAVPRDAIQTRDARLTYIERSHDEAPGPLRTRRPDGRWFEIDRDVVEILWPRSYVSPYRDAFDTREIVYLALVDGRRVVRRTVLP